MLWLKYFALLTGGRILQLCLLYFCKTPDGEPLVERWYRFFPHAVLAEVGVIALITIVCILLDRLCRKRPRLPKYFAFIVAIVFFFTSGGNDELMRWMGQHLSISFFTTYAHAAKDLHIVGQIFSEGIWHFVTSIVLALLLTEIAFWFLFKSRKIPLLHWKKVLTAMVIIMLVGMTSPEWFGKSRMRWKRIVPTFWGFYNEAMYSVRHFKIPEHYAEGIEFLGGDPQAEYPFYKEVPETEANFAEFRSRRLEEKPDIVWLTIETFRGWSGDVRNERACKLMPNICALAKRGVYYPTTYSVGFPSIEGFLGMHTGVWSHSEKTLLSERPNSIRRTLPDILGEADYYKMVLIATEPSFDNLDPWFEKWYDFDEYDPARQYDVQIADRFREVYKTRPSNKPLFFNWMSATTHTPFTLPPEFGPPDSSLSVRYEKSLAYMDSAVGIVLDEIGKGPRANNTIIVLTGDHALATARQNLAYKSGLHAGQVWVPMILAGPGIPADSIDTRAASHTDIAPTLLSLLSLKVSNNFPGVDLLDSTAKVKPAFSFRVGDAAFFLDSLAIYSENTGDICEEEFRAGYIYTETPGSIADNFVHGRGIKDARSKEICKHLVWAMDAWEWVVDKDLIYPHE